MHSVTADVNDSAPSDEDVGGRRIPGPASGPRKPAGATTMTHDQSPRTDSPVAPAELARGRQARRRRTTYASLAGWTLLGALSTGIVACSSTPTTTAGATTTAAAASTSAAATSAATSATSSAASSSAAASSAAPASTSAESSAAAAATEYKDGTYTATGSYQSPGGEESVEITLTIAGDTITDATGKSNATRPQSVEYQGQFLANFAGQIVGKNVDEVSLSKVAGSSLTSGGFNQALQTIKTDAKA